MAAWQLVVLLGLAVVCNCSRLGPALDAHGFAGHEHGAAGDARPAAQQDSGVIEYEEYEDVDDKPRRSSYVLEDAQGHLTVVEQQSRPIPGGQVFTQRTSNGDGSFSVTTVSSSSTGGSSIGSAADVTPPPAAALQVQLMPAHTLGLLQQLTQGMLPAFTSPLNDILGALEAQQQRLSGLLVARSIESAAAAASQQLDEAAAAANAAAAAALQQPATAVPCPRHQAMLAAAAAAAAASAAASQQPASLQARLRQRLFDQQVPQRQQAYRERNQVWLEELDATLDVTSSASASVSSSSMRDPLLLSGVAADGSRYLDTYEDDASYDDDSNEPADAYDVILDASSSSSADGDHLGDDDVQLDALAPWFAIIDDLQTHRQQQQQRFYASRAAAAAAGPLEAVAAWWQELGGDQLLLLLLVACTGAVVVSFLINLVQLRAAMAAAAGSCKPSGKGSSGCGGCPLMAAAAAGLASVSAVAVAGARSVAVHDVINDISDDDDLEVPLLLDADEDDACPPWQLPTVAAAAPAPAASSGVQHFYNPLYYQHLPGKM